MTFKTSIAAKIFGLAATLLLLTVALAAYLLVQAVQSRREMEHLIQFDLPFNASLAQINEYGLRRRLAFARWFGALNRDPPNQEIVAEASANYEEFKKLLQEELRGAQRRLSGEGTARPELHEIQSLLQQIDRAYRSIDERQMQVLELQRRGEHDRANELLNPLNDLIGRVQDDRARAVRTMTSFTQSVGQAAAGRQELVRTLSIAVTVSTILLGLALAALVTHRLTRPVRALMSALNSVHEGDLSIQLPVTSRDEIGALTGSFNFFIRELQAKEQIKQTFGKYIDPRIVEHVLQQPATGSITGERRVMSVVFADLVGFTALSERLTPSLMVAVLNRHFGLQARAVQDNHGVVDKFIGDAVMAFFGPPFVDDDAHPALACRTGLAMLAALEALRRELPEITGLRRDGPQLDLRIGVMTGDLVVGNIGSENTRSYTVIGDTVNLASRIESVNRVYGTRLLLAETTARQVEGQFELREIDTLAVKGKTESTVVFELLGMAGQLAPEVRELRDAYASGLQAYRTQDWDLAEKMFRRGLEIQPADGPSRVMLERLPLLRASPPPRDWNAVYALAQK